VSHNPVASVRFVPIEKIYANDYNPNSVAINELRLLHTSISHDGYTMPVVTICNPGTDQPEARARLAEIDQEMQRLQLERSAILGQLSDRFVIVDGFHRYTIMKRFPDILEKNSGLLPISVIEKPLNDRIASTVRHNRARGKHSIEGMGSIVLQLLQGGWADDQICAEIGLEPEELGRLKHITGYAKFFAVSEYSRAKESARQVKERLKHQNGAADAV
jgi:hypothetical protein